MSAINPVGPAVQPGKYAVAISAPSPTSPGLLTVVDFAGDTVITTPQILSSPTYLAISSNAQGYVVNSAGSLDIANLAAPLGLITSNIAQTTLPAGANPFSISVIAPSATANTVFIPETGRSKIAILSTATGTSPSPSLTQEISVEPNPVYVVGANGAARVYALSQGTGGNGVAAALEASTLSISNTIPVGVDPIYGVMTPDDQRAFVLNEGSGTVSVINVTTNQLDATTPTIPATGTLGPHPVWADLSPRTSELVVVSAGDGNSPGTLSIINIPLCSTLAQPGNPSCNASNPTDAAGFGTVVATVPVGVNPTMVSVLQDGTRAYVCNQGVLPTANSPGVDGSVTVVDLTTGLVTATIPAVSSAAATTDVSTTPTAVYGHPNTIAATTGTPTGKVYITASDSRYMTVLRTDDNTVQSHVSLQGLGVRVQVTAP